MLGSVLSASPNQAIDEWTARFRERSSLFWVAVGLLILHIYLIVLPFISVFIGSFTAQGSTLRGDFQFENWVRTYQTTRPVIVDTILYAVGTATLTTILACILAWAIARTNVPHSRIFYYMTFIGFFFPPVAWEIVWVRLLGQNGVFPAVLGLETLYVGTIPGMVLVASIRWLPLGLVMLVPLFASMDKTMEEAASVSGAGIIRTAKDITLRMLTPGIFAVYLLVLIVALGSFRVPLLIGAPNGITVLSVGIYQNVSVDPPSYGLAMTMSVILIVFAIPCLYLYKRSLGSTKKFATISGRGYERNPVDIGMWRYAVFAFLSLFFFIAFIVPMLLLVYTSLLPYYIPPHSLGSVSLFTLGAYSDVLTNARLLSSIGNSFIVGLVATTLIVIGSVLNAWIVQKTDIGFRNKLDYLTFSAIGLPPIPLAVGLMFVYLVYVPGGGIIYNTLLILVVAMYTRFIAGTVRVIEPGVIQLKSELLEAGRMAGDSITARLRYIVFPLIKENAQAAWAMRFSVIFLELPIVAMLHTRDTEMVAVALLAMQDQAQFPQVAAFGVVVMAFLGIVTLLVHRL